MKKIQLLIAILTLMVVSKFSFGQSQSQQFKMEGINPETITINQTFTSDAEILPFKQSVNQVFGLAVSAKIVFKSDKSVVRLLLVDKNYEEYLIYETYPLLEPTAQFSVEKICEETAVLKGVKANSVKIQVVDAQITINSFTYTKAVGQSVNIELVKKEKKQGQNEEKINKINKSLKEKKFNWIAGPTEISEMTYKMRKQLYGQGKFPAGFEYYSGGVISTGTVEQLKSATTSLYVDNWDWRNRHGKNWITPVTNQGSCGSCWAFAATGAVEAMVNVYFNQILNLNLSEQEILSCSGAGDCSGGQPRFALDYIIRNGVVDEHTFPYTATDQSCDNKGINPNDLIKINGWYAYGGSLYPPTEDILKKMLIEMGPISGGLYDWSHAMVLAGYKVVKEGDKFYYRDLNLARNWKTVAAGDPLIGKTVWIFKNSWGTGFGDAGYIYVETSPTNFGWTHALKTPLTSVVKNYQVNCEDRDGDGYFWWGLGPKPATCATCPATPDGNDADPTLGPLDQYGYCTKLSNPPVADFTSNNIITEGQSVTFTDLSSNNTTSWSWKFEGGNPVTSNSKNPTVKYDVPGNYSVTLTSANAYGSNTKTITGYINVNKTIPVYCASKGNATEEWIASVQLGGVTIASGSSGTLGYQDMAIFYTFSENAGSSQNIYLKPNFTGNAMGEYWKVWIDYNADKDFEDAGELVYTSSLSTGLVSGSITFPSNLNITTRMRISMKRDAIPSPCETFLYGEVKDYPINISIPVAQPPVASFNANKTIINKGETVTFTDLSTNNPSAWAWTFDGGNPSTSTMRNPFVSYGASGTYKVTLTATNAVGNNTKTMENYIQVNEPIPAPVANFSSDKTTVIEGGAVTFSDLSTNTPTTWAWTFVGGSPGTSSSKNPLVTYSTAGICDVTLTVTNASGSNTKTISGYMQVNNTVIAPVANFSVDNTSITMGGTVNFTDLSINSPTSWSWSFPGGTPATSTAKNPAVSYATAGTYQVTLTSTNSAGSNAKTITNCIQVNEPPVAPIAEFAAAKTSLKVGESVQFNDLSSNSPTRWQWSFPGGTPETSTEQKPIITYKVAGQYDVTLVVSKDGFSPNEKIKQKYIATVDNTPVSYCTPVGIFSTADYIQNVGIGNVLNNSTAGSSYSLSANTVSVVPGQSYTISLNPKVATNRNYWKLWIDFNGDGDFIDTGETLVAVGNKKGTLKTTILIPQNATGTTRMRIAMRTGSTSAPCDGNYKGEVEDYPVAFGVAAPMTKSAVTDLQSKVSTKLHIYPNPVNHQLNVQLDLAQPGDFYTIYNINGEKLKSDNIKSTLTTVDFGDYSPGIYLLRVINDNRVFNEKIIKK